MHFAVIREQGPNWDVSRAMRDQEYWSEHATYVNGLVDEGFLVLAGPIGEGAVAADPTSPVGDGGVYRALLIVEARTEREVTARLDEDPWTSSGVLETRTIFRWEILAGELASA